MSSKYQGRIDPLELLRNSYMNNKRPRYKDKYLIFEKDIRLPVTTPTAWVSKITKKQYSLGSLWLCMENHLKFINDYLAKVSELGLDMIVISDRDEIIKYFQGKTSDSSCISQELKLQLSNKNNPKRDQPVSGFEENQEMGNKKLKTDPTLLSQELQVIDCISKFERPVNSKTRSLRCINKSFENLLKTLQTTNNQSKQQNEKKLRINSILQKKRFPIIIVPQFSQSGNLSLGNISKFLIQGEYCEVYQQNEHQRKIEIEYTLRGKKTTFDITNNPSLLSQSDWQCVVAIFVQGRKNQFANWTIRDPLQIFKKAKGFLLRFPTNTTNEANDWNIKIHTIDKNVRYRDAQVQKAIWDEIESFLYEKV